MNYFWRLDSVRFTLFLGLAIIQLILIVLGLDKLSVRPHEPKICGIKIPVIRVYKFTPKDSKNPGEEKEENSTPLYRAKKEESETQQAELNREKLRQSLGGEWDNLFRRLEEERHLKTTNPAKIDEPMLMSDATNSYKHRQRRHKDILTRDVFPTLKNIDQPFNLVLDQASSELRKYQLRNSIIQSYRYGTPMPDAIFSLNRNKKGEKSPLHFSKEERQSYFDATIKEPKEEQLKDFQHRYFQHDPNDGDLPQAMRELYLKNLQRLLFPFSYDSSYRILDYMEEALNKEDFLINMQASLNEYHGTKLGDEILLSLENIYEIQQNALIELMNFAKSYQISTKDPVRKVTLRRLAERVIPLAEKKGLHTPLDVRKIYSARRREILTKIINEGNSRKNEARFLLGKLELQLGRDDFKQREKRWRQAFKNWKNIQINNSEKFAYASSYQELKPLLNQLPSGYNISAQKVEFILRNTDQERMVKKRDRELNLLWKDPPKKPKPRG